MVEQFKDSLLEDKDLNRKSLIAMVLIVIVMVISYLTQPQVIRKGDVEPVAAVVTETQQPVASKLAPVPEPQVVPVAVIPVAQAVLKNELVSYTFTSEGALLTDIELFEYKDYHGGGNIHLVGGNAPEGDDAAPVPYQVMHVKLLKDHGDALASAIYQVEEHDYEDYRRVSFSYRSDGQHSGLPAGLELKKTFDLYQGRYDVKVSYTISNRSKDPIHIGDHSLVIGSHINRLLGPNESGEENVVMVVNGSSDRESWAGLDAENRVTEDGDNSLYANWIGFENKYFLLTILPEDKNKLRLLARADGQGNPQVAVEQHLITVQPGDSHTYNHTVYAGPKSYKILASYGHNMKAGIDLGFFSYFAFAVLYALDFLFRYFGNYGVAIVILTIFIKVVTIPLTTKSHNAMQKNKEIQPEVDKIKERYKHDKQRLNQEIMKVYQKSGANPLSGCLPMLVQIPIFLALFKALMYAIELRGAPFALWITDLSQPDTIMRIMDVPLNILPILMIISMVVQQKFTTPPGDGSNPELQKMMIYAMPIGMGFMFYTMPSGLTLYYTLNNFLTIAQHIWLDSQKESAA